MCLSWEFEAVIKQGLESTVRRCIYTHLLHQVRCTNIQTHFSLNYFKISETRLFFSSSPVYWIIECFVFILHLSHSFYFFDLQFILSVIHLFFCFLVYPSIEWFIDSLMFSFMHSCIDIHWLSIHSPFIHPSMYSFIDLLIHSSSSFFVNFCLFTWHLIHLYQLLIYLLNDLFVYMNSSFHPPFIHPTMHLFVCLFVCLFTCSSIQVHCLSV